MFFDIDNKIFNLIINIEEKKKNRKYSNFQEIKKANIFAYNKYQIMKNENM